MSLAVVPAEKFSMPVDDDEGNTFPLKVRASGPDDWGCVVVDPGNAHHGINPTVRVRGKEKRVCWRSLCFFRLGSPVRQWTLAFVEWRWFDRFILFLIFLNSVFMATYDYRSTDSDYNHFINYVTEPVFLAFFSCEMLLKIIAWGFVYERDTYLRDGWNWLDLIVVVSAWVETLGLVENGLGFLRLFRILRPLRSLNAVPQMKVLVRTVVSSVPRLFDVIGVTVVLFVIFGSIGTTLFGGIFFRGCRMTKQPVLIRNPQQNTTFCWSWPYAQTCEGYCTNAAFTEEEDCAAGGAQWVTTSCSHDRLCGGNYMCEASSGFCGGSEEDLSWRLRPSFAGYDVPRDEAYERGVSGCPPGLPDDQPCTSRKGIPWCEGSEATWLYPETEFINFDTIGGAILLIFQCMTMEGWTDVMYYVQDAYGFWVASIYFLTLIPVTSFFLLNVALAVVDEAREDAGEDAAAEAEAEAEAQAESELEAERERSASPEKHPSEAWVTPGEGADSPEKDADQGLLAEVEGTKSGGKYETGTTSLLAAEDVSEVGSFMGDPRPGEEVWLDVCVVRFLQTVAFNPIFVNTIMFFIAANVVAMCLETFPPILVLQEPLNICETIFLVVFCIEMVIMLGAMGPKAYVMNPVTCFDGIIVIISLVQTIIQSAEGGADGGGGSAFTALRTLRLFRVLNKLANRSVSFRVLLKSMVSTGASLKYWALLFILVLYIFTLMWQTFFANRLHFNDPDSFDAVSEDQLQSWCNNEEGNQDCIPRAHFDTFIWAIVAIFQVMTGENWNTIMYSCMRSYEGVMRVVSAVLFMFLILFGQILFLSLFLSMLMAKFEQVKNAVQDVEQLKEVEKKARALRVSHSFKVGASLPKAFSLDLTVRGINSTPEVTPRTPRDGSSDSHYKVKASPRSQSHDGTVTVKTKADKRVHALDGVTEVEPTSPTVGPERKSPAEGCGKPDDALTKAPNSEPPTVQCEPDAEPSAAKGSEATTAAETKATKAEPSEKTPKDKWPKNYAWFILHRTNPARRVALKALEVEVNVFGTQIKVFDNFILFCILLSSIGMAYDTPLNDPQDPLTMVVRGSDIFFTWIFILEMAWKLFALGLFWGEGAYLRSGWNVLDGTVVMASIFSLVMPGSGSGFLKTLRILRAFRPLRVISRNPNLKVVVQTMFASMPQLATLVLVTAFFVLIFALFFLAFLCGQFYACEAPNYLADDGLIMSSSIKEFATPLCLGSNVTDQACPHGRPLVTTVRGKKEAEWIDESLSCQQSLANSYCPTSSPQLTVAWKRASWDTPICIGRCNPDAQREDPGLWEQRKWLCEADFVSAAEFPSSCKDANTPAYLASMSAEEKRGRTLVEHLTRQLVMPCGGTTVDEQGALTTPPAAAAVSCREAFCPQEVKDEKKQKCKADCEMHPHFCLESCYGSSKDSPKCKACRSECEAQCQCSDFCEPLIKDAALCHEQGGKWMPVLSQNFDNIANSLLTLFEIMSTEGWVDVMYAGADATGLYMQPRRDNQVWLAPFFVGYIFLSFMFLLNLSVGVIVDQFMELKREGKDILLTEQQRKWLETQKKLFAKNQFFPLTNLHLLAPMRRKAFDFVQHRYFENSIMMAIVLNTCFMLLKVYPQPTNWWNTTLDVFDAVFALVFLVEFLVKFYALRENYWKDPWNRFDCMCVVVSVIGVILSLIPALNDVGAITAIIRIFRIGRIFRFFEGLNKIFMALIMSIPKLANVCGILLLLLTLFSILGVSLFSTSKPGDTFNEHGNFKNFVSAFITLFRASTGEAWNEIMHDLAKSKQDFWRQGDWCAPDKLFDPEDTTNWNILNSKCMIDNPVSCTPLREAYVPAIFWVSFTLLITYMVMNLVVAVILEGYCEGQPDKDSEAIDLCMQKWKKYDPNLRMVLPLDEAMTFVREVLEELGGTEEDMAECRKWGSMLSGISKIKMSYLHIWDHVLCSNIGEVNFVQITQQVLRMQFAHRARTGKLEQGARVEAIETIVINGHEIQPKSRGTVTKVFSDGNTVVRWDHHGERLLTAINMPSLKPMEVDLLFHDLADIQGKVDERTIQKIERLELKKSNLPSRSLSTEFGSVGSNVRTMVSIVKIQRIVRARLARNKNQSAREKE